MNIFFIIKHVEINSYVFFEDFAFHLYFGLCLLTTVRNIELVAQKYLNDILIL